MYVIDFETFGINPRPEYPPQPVGVSVAKLGYPARYYAWGHTQGQNNSSFEEVRVMLLEVWATGKPLIFHNAKFDLDVWATWFNMPYVSELNAWERVHDTMLLLFLDDPNQQRLGLKPSAERLLGMPPEEQNIIAAWLVEHQPVKGVRITKSDSGKSKHSYARYIAHAPAEIVGAYANGDVERTAKLFELLYIRVKFKMSSAYDRERQLLLILLNMERQGARLNCVHLSTYIEELQSLLTQLMAWICSQFTTANITNLNSGAQLLLALQRVGKVDMSKVGMTPKGNLKTDKATLARAITDPCLGAAIAYYKQLQTLLGTFLKPWQITAIKNNGVICSTWNQTKSASNDGKMIGARTGRLSSSPNFQNIPSKFNTLFKDADHPELPEAPLNSIKPLQDIRRLFIPYEPGHVLIDLDWQQQELRLLAHYEGGVLLEAYKKNDTLDVHTYAQKLIYEMTGKEFTRKAIKGVGFGLLYGMGKARLAEAAGVSEDEALLVKEAYLNIFPGIRKLNAELERRARNSQPLRTWGGRLYYCEAATVVAGRRRSYEYKMLNTLIQGSAADCLKQAIINYYNTKPAGHRLILTVHDELLISVPEGEAEAGAKILREAMESLTLDVPLRTDTKMSGGTWE